MREVLAGALCYSPIRPFLRRAAPAAAETTRGSRSRLKRNQASKQVRSEMKSNPLARPFVALFMAFLLLAAPVGVLAKKGEKNYKSGLEYEKAQQWEKAAQEFALAVAAAPNDTEYQLHYRRAVFNASQNYMTKGRALADQGDYIGAYNAYQLPRPRGHRARPRGAGPQRRGRAGAPRAAPDRPVQRRPRRARPQAGRRDEPQRRLRPGVLAGQAAGQHRLEGRHAGARARLRLPRQRALLPEARPPHHPRRRPVEAADVPAAGAAHLLPLQHQAQ